MTVFYLGYSKPRSQKIITEACIEVLRIQDVCQFTYRDIGYYTVYFYGYEILCSIFKVTYKDIEYLGKLWEYFPVYKGYLLVYFKRYGIFGTPYTKE